MRNSVGRSVGGRGLGYTIPTIATEFFAYLTFYLIFTVAKVTLMKRIYRNRSFVFVLSVAVCLTLAACAPAPQAKQVYTVVSEPKLKAGDAIPAPSGDPILTVTGKIGTTNSDKAIVMDLATVESVGEVDYHVTDPFEGNKTVFRGPLMSNLLDLWKVPADATTLHVVALNDYVVDVPIVDLRKYPVVFALEQDGKYMPVSTRGPAMLVYPYEDFKFDTNIYNNYWAWQIKTIDVR